MIYLLTFYYPSLHPVLTMESLTLHYILLLIVIPIILGLILLITLFLLLILRRSNSKPTISSTSASSDFRKSSIQKNHQVNPNYITYSPDVRICMNGGKWGGKERKKGVQVFTYRELEEATDGFNGGNVIGNSDGGFGVVFRGKLSDGSVAAIKVFNREGKQGEREFRMEVDLLSQLESSYLVALLGYCADQHHRLLVFEFMPNATLQNHLHPLPSSGTHHHHPLDWRARLWIALDCARGLEFLHEITVPSVIHRDFNSSNILLDHNFRAKVSGFGMAKFGLDNKPNGASGYVAPEYASTGRLSTKSDVYSYGVVLLELLTGRVPVDTSRPPSEHVLVSWALPRLTNQDKVVEMVDPALQGQYTKKELIQIAAIAAVCVQPEAEYRPLITDVVQSLIPLVRTRGSSASILQHQIALPMS